MKVKSVVDDSDHQTLYSVLTTRTICLSVYLADVRRIPVGVELAIDVATMACICLFGSEIPGILEGEFWTILITVLGWGDSRTTGRRLRPSSAAN